MKCPFCNGPTRVTDTRSLTYDTDGIPEVIYHPLRKCVHLVDTFTDFKARFRKCLDCGQTTVTVELNVKEVDKLLDKQAKVVYKVLPKHVKVYKKREQYKSQGTY